MRHATLLLVAIGVASCGGVAPVSPTPVPVSPAPVTTSPVPPPVTSALAIAMPVATGDQVATSFGLNPFGIHFGGTGPGGHGVDGHPGWDVEYRIGARVRAAADGTVQSVFADSFTPDRFTVQLAHTAGSGFRTVYTNLTSLDGAVVTGAHVVEGQALGSAGTQTVMVGTRPVTYAMTHFQVDDFSRNEGATNPNAVNPESFLHARGRALFDEIWRTAAYNVELTEPFAGNPRDVAFPLTRTWQLESGALPAVFEVTRRDPVSSSQSYVLRDARGAAIEQGMLTVEVGLPATIELRQERDVTRLGLYDVVGDTLRIDLGEPGGSRPADLTRASAYRTR